MPDHRRSIGQRGDLVDGNPQPRAVVGGGCPRRLEEWFECLTVRGEQLLDELEQGVRAAGCESP